MAKKQAAKAPAVQDDVLDIDGDDELDLDDLNTLMGNGATEDLDTEPIEDDEDSADGVEAEGEEAASAEAEPAEAPAPVEEPADEPAAEPGEAEEQLAEATPKEPMQEGQPAPQPQTLESPSAQEQAAAGPTVPQLSPEEAQRQYVEWRTKSEEALAQHHFNISEEMAEELEAEPHKAVPKLLARVYMDAVTNSVGQVVNHLPALLNQALAQRDSAQKAEAAFFEMWPQLKEHSQTVMQIGQTFRQQYPGATQDQFMKLVGGSAMVALGIQPHQAQAAQQQQPQAAPPFRPVVSAPAPPPASQKKNVWEELADFDEHDLDLD